MARARVRQVSSADSASAGEGLVHVHGGAGERTGHPATPGPPPPPEVTRRRTRAAAPAAFTRLRPARRIAR